MRAGLVATGLVDVGQVRVRLMDIPLTDSSRNSDILSVSVESEAVANMNSPAAALNEE